VQRGAKARPTQHEPRSRRIEGSLCTTRPGSARLRRGLTADRSRAEDIVQRHSWAPGAMLRNCWRTNVQCQPGLSTSYVTFSSTPPEPRVPDQSRPTSTTTQSRQSTEALISSRSAGSSSQMRTVLRVSMGGQPARWSGACFGRRKWGRGTTPQTHDSSLRGRRERACMHDIFWACDR